jgi:FkbM family methyltransferase
MIYLKKILRFSGHSFFNVLDNQSIIVDCGSHKGEFTKLLIKHYPNGHYFLIEANPILSNFCSSYFSKERNVKTFNAAIGGERKYYVPFYISTNPKSSSLSKSIIGKRWIYFLRFRKIKKEVAVPMITLSHLLKKEKIKKIDLLKLDVEGAELDILENMAYNDAKRIYQISVEFHHFLDHSLKKRAQIISQKMKSLGYNIYSRDSSGKDVLFYKPEILQ